MFPPIARSMQTEQKAGQIRHSYPSIHRERRRGQQRRRKRESRQERGTTAKRAKTRGGPPHLMDSSGEGREGRLPVCFVPGAPVEPRRPQLNYELSFCAYGSH